MILHLQQHKLSVIITLLSQGVEHKNDIQPMEILQQTTIQDRFWKSSQQVWQGLSGMLKENGDVKQGHTPVLYYLLMRMI